LNVSSIGIDKSFNLPDDPCVAPDDSTSGGVSALAHIDDKGCQEQGSRPLAQVEDSPEAEMTLPQRFGTLQTGAADHSVIDFGS